MEAGLSGHRGACARKHAGEAIPTGRVSATATAEHCVSDLPRNARYATLLNVRVGGLVENILLLCSAVLSMFRTETLNPLRARCF